MQKRKYTFGSIYSDEERRLLGPWQDIRQRLLGPVVLALSRLGINADFLSFTSAALGIAFCFLAPFYYDLAFWLLVVSVLCDGLDGVAARLKGDNTPRGAFTDMFCDQVVVAFSVAGMAWRGAIHPILAVLFVYIYTAIVVFLMLHHLLQVHSRWIVRPSRMVLYAVIAVDYFFRIDLLNYLLGFYLLALPLLVLSFWRLRGAL